MKNCSHQNEGYCTQCQVQILEKRLDLVIRLLHLKPEIENILETVAEGIWENCPECGGQGFFYGANDTKGSFSYTSSEAIKLPCQCCKGIGLTRINLPEGIANAN